VTRPYHCGVCGVGATWRITRRGDNVVGWACPNHLAPVCDQLQRDDEVTELVVVLIAKLTEWAQLRARLDDIADKPDSR
jgi:hypothetical protein